MTTEPVTTKIDGFELDAVVTVDISLSSEISEHPVEDGSDVADHTRNRPTTVTLDCVVSNTPLGTLAARRGTETQPSEQAYARMKAIHVARLPITIETHVDVFKLMVLESLSRPITSATGDAMRFRATFKQLRLVVNERTTVEVAVPRAKKKVDRGLKASPPATPPAATDEKVSGYQDSWLGQITDAIGVTN